MFTIPNLSLFLANYRAGTQPENPLQHLRPSTVLGPRRGKVAQSAYKNLERELKTPLDADHVPRDFWQDFFTKPRIKSTLSFITDDWSFDRKTAFKERFNGAARRPGYFWSDDPAQSVDRTHWRALSPFLLGLEADISTSEPKGELQRVAQLVREEIELIETVSAQADESHRKNNGTALLAFLSAHPLRKTASVRSFLELLDTGNVPDDPSMGVSMSLSGLLWQLAVLDRALFDEQVRDRWPLSGTLEPDRGVGLSAIWMHRFIEYTREEILPPAPKRSGRPAKTADIAKFLLEHDEAYEVGTNPDKLSERLARVLNGKEVLSYRVLSAQYTNLVRSVRQNLSAQRLESLAPALTRIFFDGHVSAFHDYFGQGFCRKLQENGYVDAKSCFDAFWKDWPVLQSAMQTYFESKIHEASKE